MANSEEITRRTDTITPPAPGQNPIAWAMQNPQALQKLIELHNQMQNLEISVVQNGQTFRAPLVRTPGGSNAIIELRLPTL